MIAVSFGSADIGQLNFFLSPIHYRDITFADVVLLQRYLMTDAVTIPYPQNSDMNHDNVLTAVDLALLKQKLIKG